MDWPNIIRTLLDAGWTQVKLAEECGCSQSSISDMANGKTSRPAYDIGKRLEQLVAGLPQTQTA